MINRKPLQKPTPPETRLPVPDNSKVKKTGDAMTGALEGVKTKITIEGGYAVKLTNRTGAASIKGTLVAASTSYDNAVMIPANEFSGKWAMYENGVADGSECWVVVSGVMELLIKDGTAATHGNWVKASDTLGRVDATTPPSALG